MKLVEAVGKRVEQLLNERGITQYALAQEGGIPRQTINIVVNGSHDRVALITIYQIAATFNMSLEEFFADPIFNDLSD
ncbi:MAG: helix-turn-helix transcriptional regulator [Clostridiales bacterium]|nr:helix-turn-helix transcriptional regulator [Clostridiales bacterium]